LPAAFNSYTCAGNQPQTVGVPQGPLGIDGSPSSELQEGVAPLTWGDHVRQGVEQIGRGVGRGLYGVVRGLLDIPLMINDTLGHLLATASRGTSALGLTPEFEVVHEYSLYAQGLRDAQRAGTDGAYVRSALLSCQRSCESGSSALLVQESVLSRQSPPGPFKRPSLASAAGLIRRDRTFAA
jgi:hypothetical protein